MANPIKTSEFYEDTGELKKLIAELQQVQEELKALREVEVANANAINKSIKKVNATTTKQRETIEASAKQADEIAKRYKIYNESLSENSKKIAALKNAQRQLNQVNKLEAKLLASKEGSYNKLSAQYSLNKIRLNQMSEAERKGTKAGKELVKVTNDIYQEMKQLQEETGKTSLNVGNYQEAIEQADRASGGFIGSIKAIGKSFKALLLNPVALFLTVIVGALAALGNAFKSSDKGARLLEKGTALVSAGFNILVDLSVAVAEGIEFAFGTVANSKIGNFAGILVGRVLTALKGIVNTVGFVGEAFQNLIDGEFKKATESAINAGKSIGQAFSGIELTENSELVKGLEKIVEKTTEATSATLALNAARLSTARSNRELTKSVENLTTKEALLRTFADDTTKSFKERETAAENARKALEARSSKEIQIAKNNLSLINQEIDLRRSSKLDVEALLDQQLSSYSALKAAEREFTLAVRDNERTRDELKQDRLERDLDILLDIFDNQKTINEKLIADDELTFTKRKAILDETNELSDSSFAKQIETIQKFTGVAIDANELIAESDAIVLNQKIRNLGLSEIIEGRLIEIIRDRKSANQELADSESDLNKAIKKNEEDQLKFRTSLISKAKKAYEDFQKARYEGSLETFDQQQALAKSEFDLQKSTEEEKTRFALNAEKERIQKLIDLNKISTEKLSDVQLETFKNQIKKIDQELDKVGQRQVNDIYDLFGFNLTDEKKTALTESLSFVKEQFSDLANTRVELSNQNVDTANTEVAASQRQLDIEIANRQAGLADKVETAQKELAAAKKNQEDAIKEQQKAQRAQQRIQTIEQSVNMVTAASNIWKSLGFPLAIPAIGLMFGSFIAAKVKANQLSKKEFSEGGLEIIGGGSHASGNDTYLGFQSEGKAAFGEKGEAHIILPKGKTSKYKSILPSLVDSLQKGTFEKNYMSMNASHVSDSPNVYIQSESSTAATDTSKMEDDLSAIRRNGERSYTTNGKGQTVERYKNITRTYV